jgi:hypothetical protein
MCRRPDSCALPAAPTRCLPGTPEKIAVLRERARLRQALWHPLDATLGGAPGGDRAPAVEPFHRLMNAG